MNAVVCGQIVYSDLLTNGFKDDKDETKKATTTIAMMMAVTNDDDGNDENDDDDDIVSDSNNFNDHDNAGCFHLNFFCFLAKPGAEE